MVYYKNGASLKKFLLNQSIENENSASWFKTVTRLLLWDSKIID